LVNFDANIGGMDRFWWANSDGSANTEAYDEPSAALLCPGSWTPARFDSLDDGILVRNWLIAGPFGGPGAEKFTEHMHPRDTPDILEFFEKASYPPDSHVVNPAEKFSGAQITGYWQTPNPPEIGWRKGVLADLDTRILLGMMAQCWYGATWIYAPSDVEVEMELQGHKQTNIRWYINRELFFGDPWNSPNYFTKTERADTPELANLFQAQFATQPVQLKAGWNQISYRAYGFGYPPFKVGLLIKAKEDTLWKLKLAGEPPK